MFYKNNLKNKGFTLIELLVVIAIVGLLSSVVLASLNIARSKARDAQRISDIRQLQKALSLYYDKYGHYPVSDTECATGSSWCISGVSGSIVNGHWIRDRSDGDRTLGEFLGKDPVDPRQAVVAGFNTLNNYNYFSSNTSSQYASIPGSWYMIVFSLENPTTAYNANDGVITPNNYCFNYGLPGACSSGNAQPGTLTGLHGTNGIMTWGASN